MYDTKKYAKTYRQKHKEQIKAYAKAYRQEHKEEIKRLGGKRTSTFTNINGRTAKIGLTANISFFRFGITSRTRLLSLTETMLSVQRLWVYR